jgi:hypothetical protein
MIPDITFWGMFYLMIFAHYLADYPLQGDFLANAKNPNTPIGKIFWKHALFAHSMIHGGFVAVITGSITLGLLETAAHAFIDYAKCDEKINLNQDQILHIGCKLLWVILAFTM